MRYLQWFFRSVTVTVPVPDRSLALKNKITKTVTVTYNKAILENLIETI